MPLGLSYNRSPGGAALIRPTILAMFVGSCVFATASLSLAQSKRFSLNSEQAQTEAVHFLVDLVRIDTQDPPGDESKVANYIEGVLKNEGIESEILEPVPGRASIVARLKGNGKRRALLLMGHEDVVPVDRSHWTVDPFAADERDGVIYGRGASDDKAMVAANLEVLLQERLVKIVRLYEEQKKVCALEQLQER